jgi:hypothetical protein
MDQINTAVKSLALEPSVDSQITDTSSHAVWLKDQLLRVFADDRAAIATNSVEVVEPDTVRVFVEKKAVFYRIKKHDTSVGYDISMLVPAICCDSNTLHTSVIVTRAENGDDVEEFMHKWLTGQKKLLPEIFYQETKARVNKWINNRVPQLYEAANIEVVATLTGVELHIVTYEPNESGVLVQLPTERVPISYKVQKREHWKDTDAAITQQEFIPNGLIVTCFWKGVCYQMVFAEEYQTTQWIGYVLSLFLWRMIVGYAFESTFYLLYPKNEKDVQDLVDELPKNEKQYTEKRSALLARLLSNVFDTEQNGGPEHTVKCMDDDSVHVVVNDREVVFTLNKSEIDENDVVVVHIAGNQCDSGEPGSTRMVLPINDRELHLRNWLIDFKDRLPDILYGASKHKIVDWITNYMRTPDLNIVVNTTLTGVVLNIKRSVYIACDNELFEIQQAKVPISYATIENMLVITTIWYNTEYMLYFGADFKDDALVGRILLSFLYFRMVATSSLVREFFIDSKETERSVKRLLESSNGFWAAPTKEEAQRMENERRQRL